MTAAVELLNRMAGGFGRCATVQFRITRGAQSIVLAKAAPDVDASGVRKTIAFLQGTSAKVGGTRLFMEKTIAMMEGIEQLTLNLMPFSGKLRDRHDSWLDPVARSAGRW